MSAKAKTTPKNVTETLLHWYRENGRPLPWRKNRDPYRIWISEVMLQQTTVTAVVPYFERFIKRFANVQSLAEAKLEEVFEYWSGLGYYSRARNLHKSAGFLSNMKFPLTTQELLGLPGFGPYTARAVASFAFSEAVGVLDGNVIRFLSRYHGLPLEWWKPRERQKLQELADNWVHGFDSHDVNQALIEIGATICLSSSPKCLLCPAMPKCRARQTKKIDRLPLVRPRRKTEIWIWRPELYMRKGQVALTLDHTLPFLRQHWVWPGAAVRRPQKPKIFDFEHAVTHHKIYVQVQKKSSRPKGYVKWIKLSQVRQLAPTSLVNKVLGFAKR